MPKRGKETGEARRHFRSPPTLVWPAEHAPVRSSSGAPSPRARTETRGISLGGTFVVSDDPPAVDTDLHLWLYPPHRPPGAPAALRFLARVRWINDTPGDLPRGFGVAFRALTSADEIALHQCFSRSAKVV